MKITRLLKWVVYWCITQKERHLYEIGKIEGCLCTGYDDNIFGRRYQFDRSKRPVRYFATYNEFMKFQENNEQGKYHRTAKN